MNSQLKIRLLIITILFLLENVGASCVNDTRCSDCRLYYLTTQMGIFGYYNCDQCIANRTVNQQSGSCQCILGYYEQSATQCNVCPTTCASCSSPQVCSSCYAQDYRQLIGNSCECMDGYQSKNSERTCKQKPNVLMIVLSTIGSAICMVLGFVVCAFIRMRRGSQQIHADNMKKRRNPNNGQLQLYCQQHQSNTMQNNSSNVYWNTKIAQFKMDEICSICLDANPFFMTDCNHYFHSKCIYSWLSTKTTCPNCNKEIEGKCIRRWCQKCKKVLMPVVMNVLIKRQNKKKKDIIQSSPIDIQFCDECENEIESQEVQAFEKPVVELKDEQIKIPQKKISKQIMKSNNRTSINAEHF